MIRIAFWVLTGLFSAALTVLIFFPTTWASALIESHSSGRLILAEGQGSIWDGSAIIASKSSQSETVTALIPSRISWHLSPMILLNQVDVELANSSSLSHAIHITGSWSHWRVTAAEITLGADRFNNFGAPLNTIQLTGLIHLTWNTLQISFLNSVPQINGELNLHMEDIASRLSHVKPLGSYNLKITYNGENALLQLSTLKGAMELSGSGTLNNGQSQFSGTARASAGQEEKLANFLNLLGQSRLENGHEIISLEFN
jgi:general secretion pathway protein N